MTDLAIQPADAALNAELGFVGADCTVWTLEYCVTTGVAPEISRDVLAVARRAARAAADLADTTRQCDNVYCELSGPEMLLTDAAREKAEALGIEYQCARDRHKSLRVELKLITREWRVVYQRESTS